MTADICHPALSIDQVAAILAGFAPHVAARVHDLLIDGRFLDVIWTLPRECRWTYVELVAPHMPEAEGVRCLLACWGDTEHHVHRDRVLALFRWWESLRATVPSNLPAVVTAYRGLQAPTLTTARRRVRQPSWTLSRWVARWFAARWGEAGAPIRWVASARVPRAAILAYRRGREAEIIVEPSALRRIAVAPLDENDATFARAWGAKTVKAEMERQRRTLPAAMARCRARRREQESA